MFAFVNNSNICNETRDNYKKNFRRVVFPLVEKYFRGTYESRLNIFDVVQLELNDVHFTAVEGGQLKKLLQLFYLGQLVGLPTLHSILHQYGISSNTHQINYIKLCKKVSHSTLHKIFESVFEHEVLCQLQNMSEKDSSCWSRELVTAVLDDSIFKQWHNSQDIAKDFEGCFGKFFSGQFMAAVYGLKVVTFALSIDGVIYPLYFDYVKKAPSKLDKVDKATKIAAGLVEKWGLFLRKAKKKGVLIPKLHFSCDSGYSDLVLSQTCESNKLTYISVPKKSHLFEMTDRKGRVSKSNLEDWVKDVFLQKEQKHELAQAKLDKKDRKVFIYRFKAFYCSQKREVTLLAFRLNGSKKVSIIYSTSKNIFAKTLRRHWFQRTYIEQFFKLLKHVLKIQESRVKTKQEFQTKLCRFAFVALHAQKLLKYLRTKNKECQKYGLITIQRWLVKEKQMDDLLQKILNI